MSTTTKTNSSPLHLTRLLFICKRLSNSNTLKVTTKDLVLHYTNDQWSLGSLKCRADLARNEAEIICGMQWSSTRSLSLVLPGSQEERTLASISWISNIEEDQCLQQYATATGPLQSTAPMMPHRSWWCHSFRKLDFCHTLWKPLSSALAPLGRRTLMETPNDPDHNNHTKTELWIIEDSALCS